MKITNPQDVKIGHWYTLCCHMDLAIIETQSNLDNVLHEFLDFKDPIVEVWETQREALLEIRVGWGDYPNIQAEIDEMIASIPA